MDRSMGIGSRGAHLDRVARGRAATGLQAAFKARSSARAEAAPVAEPIAAGGAMTSTGTDDRQSTRTRTFVARHPIGVLLVTGTAFVWVTQMGSLLAGADVMPAKLGELLVLLGLAVWISAVVGG